MPYVDFTRKNKYIRGILEKYVLSKNIEDLSGCTFYYIAEYLDTGVYPGRLSVALMDFGYAIEDLQKDKISGWELAQSWLATGSG